MVPSHAFITSVLSLSTTTGHDSMKEVPFYKYRYSRQHLFEVENLVSVYHRKHRKPVVYGAYNLVAREWNALLYMSILLVDTRADPELIKGEANRRVNYLVVVTNVWTKSKILNLEMNTVFRVTLACLRAKLLLTFLTLVLALLYSHHVTRRPSILTIGVRTGVTTRAMALPPSILDGCIE